MKRILVILLIFFSCNTFSQNGLWPTDSLKEYQGDVIPVYTKEYMNLYNRMKRLVLKVYPYALYAADVIDEIDQNTANIDRRRKKNKFYKDSYQELKDDFKYFILDLYTSEGRMLMKLIHRETGMTVYDISAKYRGESKATVFNGLAKIWDQDLHISYDPTTGNDKVVEQVILDIQSGLIEFDDAIVTVDKLQYREEKQKAKARLKANKKRKKENKKAKKAKERISKKIARKNARRK